jgi:hypothetical protein
MKIAEDIYIGYSEEKYLTVVGGYNDTIASGILEITGMRVPNHFMLSNYYADIIDENEPLENYDGKIACVSQGFLKIYDDSGLTAIIEGDEIKAYYKEPPVPTLYPAETDTLIIQVTNPKVVKVLESTNYENVDAECVRKYTYLLGGEE